MLFLLHFSLTLNEILNDMYNVAYAQRGTQTVFS